MKKVYCVGTCSTCTRIIADAGLTKKGFISQNIKVDSITAAQLDEMKEMIGSYEALFSRRAMKFKVMKLGARSLTEKDYRDLILKEYTFLKRPVVISGKNIFSGSAPKTVAELMKLK